MGVVSSGTLTTGIDNPTSHHLTVYNIIYQFTCRRIFFLVMMNSCQELSSLF